MGIVKLFINGEEMKDEQVIGKVPRSLPKKAEMVVTAILKSKDLTKLTIEQLTGCFMFHQNETKSRG